MPVLQKITRFDQSMICPLLHRFYAEAGPEAWSSNIVPQRSTSNAFCADTRGAAAAPQATVAIRPGGSSGGTEVPEPGVLGLFGLGTLAAAWSRRKRFGKGKNHTN